MAYPGRSNPHLAVGRVDRQHRLIESLEAVAPRTVPARRLAELLEVSVRTVERDIGQLVQAGVGIRRRRGRDGGFAMDGHRLVAPIPLDRAEVAVLVTALVGLGDYASATARSALQKLTAALAK